ncbi:MAG: hypothetical protein ACLQVN_12040 [Bryobacteraceae bacterium]
MIAAVKGWHAVLAAAWIVVPARAWAADDVAGAARELAAKTALFAGAGATVSVSYRNLSSLGPAQLEQARAGYEAGLRQVGMRLGDGGAVEAQISLSENGSQYLLIADLHKGDDRQVAMAAWKRGPGAKPAGSSAWIERKVVWEQEEQVLDAAFPGDAMVLLAPSGVSIYAKRGERWELRQVLRIPSPHQWPRDLRGHLGFQGASFRAFLPGLTCSGAMEPQPGMECRAGDDPWSMESAGGADMSAYFAPGRNYFDGRLALGNGAMRGGPPFYSAAATGDPRHPVWLLALLNGKAQVVDGGFNVLAEISGWGSDIASIETRCGTGTQVLATQSSDANATDATDAIQSYLWKDRSMAAATPAAVFPGPVTALWARGGSAVAVARDSETEKYVVYVLTVACGG